MTMEKFCINLFMGITNFYVITILHYEKLKCMKLKYLFSAFLAKALLLLLPGIEPMEESLREGNKKRLIFNGILSKLIRRNKYC